MNEICMLCNEYNAGEKWNVRIYDDKTSTIISGHKSCVDDIHEQIANIKSLEKKPVKKVLEEIGLEHIIK